MYSRIHALLTARCPICCCRYGARMRRRATEALSRCFLLRPYECRSCNHRFYSYGFRSPR